MVLLPLAPVLLGPTSRVRVASTVSPSFFLSAPLIAPRMVWCSHPVAAAICSTVAPSGRLSISIIWACLVPARGVRVAAGAASVTLALPLADLRFFAGLGVPSAPVARAGASTPAPADVAPVSPGVAPFGASSSVSTPMAWRPARVIRSGGGSSPRGAPLVIDQAFGFQAAEDLVDGAALDLE